MFFLEFVFTVQRTVFKFGLPSSRFLFSGGGGVRYSFISRLGNLFLGQVSLNILVFLSHPFSKSLLEVSSFVSTFCQSLLEGFVSRDGHSQAGVGSFFWVFFTFIDLKSMWVALFFFYEEHFSEFNVFSFIVPLPGRQAMSLIQFPSVMLCVVLCQAHGLFELKTYFSEGKKNEYGTIFTTLNDVTHLESVWYDRLQR